MEALWKDYFSPLSSRYVTRQQMMHKHGLHTNREEKTLDQIDHCQQYGS